MPAPAASPLPAASLPAARVAHVLVGRTRTVEGASRTFESAIQKTPVAGPVQVDPLGLVGDEVADHENHGGPDKAVLAYSTAHRAFWADVHPDLAEPGAFGENLLLEGVDEHTVCIGDRWQIGGATVEVTQARLACWKLDQRWAMPTLSATVTAAGNPGWYLRVCEPGVVNTADAATCLDRPNPGWTIYRAHQVMEVTRSPADLLELAELPGVSAAWQTMARARANR